MVRRKKINQTLKVPQIVINIEINIYISNFTSDKWLNLISFIFVFDLNESRKCPYIHSKQFLFHNILSNVCLFLYIQNFLILLKCMAYAMKTFIFYSFNWINILAKFFVPLFLVDFLNNTFISLCRPVIRYLK